MEHHDRIASDYPGLLPALAVRTLGRVLAQGYLVNSRTTGATVWPGGKQMLVAPPALDRARLVLGPPHLEVAAPVQWVVMVGRISPWKSQVVLRAGLRRHHVEAHVVGGALIKEREFEAELHRMASAGRCAGRINFTVYLDDVWQHLLAPDVLVHVSVAPEPFGLVVSEGMAAGFAVIAMAPGGPAEVITHGWGGLLVAGGDVDAVFTALQQLQADAAAGGSSACSCYDATVQAAWVQPWLPAVDHGVAPSPRATSRTGAAVTGATEAARSTRSRASAGSTSHAARVPSSSAAGSTPDQVARHRSTQSP